MNKSSVLTLYEFRDELVDFEVTIMITLGTIDELNNRLFSSHQIILKICTDLSSSGHRLRKRN